MYCVVYRFQVIPGKNKDFERAWSELTDAIYQHCGSMGSSLHRSDDHCYMAFAQWPNLPVWEESSSKLPGWAGAIQDRMKSCCHSIETVFAGERISDLLKNAPSGNL
jgi:heme-degrading monooxygenase HmoA